MILDKFITIQTLSTTYDSERIPIETWTANQTLNVAMERQPFLDDSIISEEYGMSNIKITDKFFCKPNSTILNNYKNGILTRLVDGTEIFLIKRLQTYPIHYELLCEPVIE